MSKIIQSGAVGELDRCSRAVAFQLEKVDLITAEQLLAYSWYGSKEKAC
ncbi:hypothetical protein RI049_24000 [Cedecea neteri]|nr:hypothetical protein [Cedecea neteri]WPU23024.1 hypothetical protein RI049_24000 [Cedecea neteri]